MKSHLFLASLLAGAIGVFALTAGEQPRQSTSDDCNNVNELREEKLERSLATLQDRCQKMLDMQIAVHNGTKDLHKFIDGTPDKKPRPADRQASRVLSDKQKAIVAQATKAIEMLEADGSADAFPEVVRQLRDDMKLVQHRLKIGDVGSATQAIEKDIIDTLEEMIAATKRG